MTSVMVIPEEVRRIPARLPVSYEAAKNALSNCVTLDECQDWANKAEALASYAKQADDDTLRKLADRIQARAVRRCGELLKTFSNQRARTDLDKGALTQRQVASDAGMSLHQERTAVRVANVPLATFEEAVEAEAPLTVTKLAEIGKQSRAPAREPEPPPPVEPAPAGFKEATAFIGTIKRFSDACESTAPELVANGVMRTEIADLRRRVGVIDRWMDRFIINLKGA